MDAGVATKSKGWNLGVKLTTRGDSGFKSDKVSGQFTLPYPTGFEDRKAHCYRPISQLHKYKAAAEKADNIIKLNQNISENNKAHSDPGVYDPLEPISPMVPWRLMDKADKEFWSDAREGFVHQWLTQNNESRSIDVSETAVLDLVDGIKASLEESISQVSELY